MKRTACLLSAVMAVSGFGAISTFAADPAVNPPTPNTPADNQMNRAGQDANNATNNAGAAVNNAGNATGNAAQSTGDKMRNGLEHAGAGTPSAQTPAPDAKDIRKSIANVTEDALTKGDMKHIVGYFVTADEERIEKTASYDQNYGDTLDGRIAQINDQWKQKYGHDFKTPDVNDTLGDQFASIQQGQIGNANDAQLASAVLRNSENANPGADKNANGKSESTEKLENGRSIALVTVKGTNGSPDIQVPLIHELPDSWRINVPDSMDANKLRQNLLDQLTAVGNNSAQWPSDEKEAYREVARHVLMAVLDQSAQNQNPAAH